MKRIPIAATVSLMLLWPTWAFPQPSYCSTFESPDLSEFGWVLVDEYKYEAEELGASAGYQSELGKFTFFSYDIGLEIITEDVVKDQLFEAVRVAIEAYSTYEPDRELNSPKIMPEYVITNMIASFPYVRTGVVFESSVQGAKTVDIVTVGTDGNCIYKVRYTAALDNTIASPLVAGLNESSKILHAFFSGF